MITKLTRRGSSAILEIDASMLEKLNLGTELAVAVSAEDGRLVVQPAPDAMRKQRVAKAMDSIERDYDAMFKRLAE